MRHWTHAWIALSVAFAALGCDRNPTVIVVQPGVPVGATAELWDRDMPWHCFWNEKDPNSDAACGKKHDECIAIRGLRKQVHEERPQGTFSPPLNASDCRGATYAFCFNAANAEDAQKTFYFCYPSPTACSWGSENLGPTKKRIDRECHIDLGVRKSSE